MGTMKVLRLTGRLSLLVFCFWVVLSCTAPTDPQSATPVTPTGEQNGEFIFTLRGKQVALPTGLRLSAVFNALGDPEDIDHVNSPYRLYGWGLDNHSGQSLIIDANPKEDVVADWLVARFHDGRLERRTYFAHAGKSRKFLHRSMETMRQARTRGKPTCPDGLRCTTYNRSRGHGHPFEILKDRDLVGPSVWVTLQFEGVGSFPMPDSLAKSVSMTVETPHGKRYTGNLRGPVGFSGERLDHRRVIQVDGSFFFWVQPEMPDSEVPIGRYRYHATFLGARSRTAEVTVHRQAIVLPSPNEENDEIAITPFYDKLPIQGLKYDDLVAACKTRFKRSFEGEAQDALIPAYEYIDCEGPHGSSAVMRLARQFPLRRFGIVEIRKRK